MIPASVAIVTAPTVAVSVATPPKPEKTITATENANRFR